MSRKLIIVVELVIISSLISACMGEKVNMSLKLKKGDRFSIEYLSEEEIDNSIKEIINFSKLKKEIKYNCEVVDIDDNKNSKINVKFDEVSFYLLSNDGNSIEYTSQLIEQQDNLLFAFFSSLIDKSFEVYIGENGKVDKIIGLDKIIEDGFAMINTEVINNFEQYKQIISKEFSSESMKTNLNSMNSFYNSENLKVGSSFEKESDLKIIVHLMSNNKYELEDVSDNSAKIKLSSIIKTKPENDTIVVGENNYAVDIEGEQNGFIVLDKDSSLMKEYNTNYELTGMIKITSGNPEKGAREIPLVIKGKTEVIIRK
ncbi:DUF6263 family protein [Clostridium sp. DL1XJH146]